MLVIGLNRPVTPMPLNESPSEKEGKSPSSSPTGGITATLNESPSEKEGKSATAPRSPSYPEPSMKVPPKRKGNVPRLVILEPASGPQ